MIPDWTNSEDWDYLYLAGRRVPGIVTVTATAHSGITTAQPKGSKKASQKDKGAPPVKLQVETELQPDEIDEFEQEIVPLLRPRNLFAPREPLEIAHPEARIWGVNVVIAGEINSQHPQSGGTKKIAFSLEEYADPSKLNKASKKPKSGDDTHGSNAEWNVQPLIDTLRPGNSGAAAANF